MSTVKIRIYEGEGMAVPTELDLIETRTVETPGSDVLTGRDVAILLAKECPEFRSTSGISIKKTQDGWCSSRSLRRAAGASICYVWQDAVVSVD